MTTHQPIAELTVKVVVVAIFLALILAASNTYLALKIGILTSASIPAAVLSMGILRTFFKRVTILENNLVQTAASAGEAVAGGIVYTIPALIILHYWSHFAYWENFFIAVIGGILGVLFSVPLRRVLMNEQNLRFPEGRAIAEVLRITERQNFGLREMLYGSGIGALLEFAQVGLQVIANSFQVWMVAARSFVGFGGGFSATLVGAGYLVGFRIGLSIFIGALLGWVLAIPIFSHDHAIVSQVISGDIGAVVNHFWSAHIRYLGIGAMLTAGIWTLITLLKPFYASLKLSLRAIIDRRVTAHLPKTERDIPMHYLLGGLVLALIAAYLLFQNLFQFDPLGLPSEWHVLFLISSVFYVLVIGFIFAAICGYFSGLVGVTASPGSAVIIGGLFIAALLIRLAMTSQYTHLDATQLLNAAAITIIIGGIITGAAAISNDNIQDLKVGHIVGATPWKQQVMLMLGVVVAAAIIPPIMEILFQVYGIGDVLPRPDMDPSRALAAPPAAMMAAVTQAVFNYQLPWDMLGIGATIMIMFIVVNKILSRRIELSPLGVAIGMYLPMSSSIPIFLGSIIAWLVKRKLSGLEEDKRSSSQQRGAIFACGLVAGAALMDVVLAIPFSLTSNPDILKIMPAHLQSLTQVLGVLSFIGLMYLFQRVINN